jgi:hypothetical protein
VSLTFSPRMSVYDNDEMLDSMPRLNVSVSNTYFLHEKLGFDAEEETYGGDIDAEEFLGMIHAAQAIAPKDHDYLQMQLVELEKIAVWAKVNDRKVQWA